MPRFLPIKIAAVTGKEGHDNPSPRTLPRWLGNSMLFVGCLALSVVAGLGCAHAASKNIGTLYAKDGSTKVARMTGTIANSKTMHTASLSVYDLNKNDNRAVYGQLMGQHNEYRYQAAAGGGRVPKYILVGDGTVSTGSTHTSTGKSLGLPAKTTSNTINVTVMTTRARVCQEVPLWAHNCSSYVGLQTNY